MDGLFSMAGGARRRPTRPPAPDVDSSVYRMHVSGNPPEDGNVSADAVRPSSMTHLYVAIKGDELQDNSNWLAEVCANMYDLTLKLADDPDSYAMFRVTAVTVNASYYDFTVTHLASKGDLPDGAAVRFDILAVPNAILTTKGDLLSRSSTTPVRRAVGVDGAVLVADASQTSGLNWLTYVSMWYGTGRDGSNTLGANTALATRVSYCVNYTTLDLSTFTLKGFVGSGLDKSSVYCCSVLLTGNGGSILPALHTTVAGGAARVSGATSGAGGDGPEASSGVFVFARKASGTVTVNGSGRTGGNGLNASGTATGTVAGANGNNGNGVQYFTAAVINAQGGQAGLAGGAAGGTGGTGGAAIASEEHTSGYYDILRYFVSVRASAIETISDGTRWARIVRSPGGSGGGSGGVATTTASGGGGGAASFSMGPNAGTNGGNGGAGGTGGGAGGGGGASGGAGCFVGVMVGEFAAGSNFSVKADGGTGGNGGNGVGNGGGGGGGAGGVGGYAYVVFPVNYTSVTTSVTAAAGVKGNKGLKAGVGTDGNDGQAGNAGHAAIMVMFG